jgi:hypothetical protein
MTPPAAAPVADTTAAPAADTAISDAPVQHGSAPALPPPVPDDDDAKDEISFVTYIIGEFADAYKMRKPDAYAYLKKYGGLDYIFECWWALHIDNPIWAVRDTYHVCRNNGGLR